MLGIDFGSMFVAFVGVTLAVSVSIGAGIVSARVFFHASREIDDKQP